MECINRKKNLEKCTCTYASCSRRGMCCLCIKHHREHNELPGCLFPKDAERAYDRSVKRFIESVRK